MAEQLFTMSGTKIYIGSEPVNSKSNPTLPDFAGVQWLLIDGLYNVGELGGEQTINEFELITEEWMRKVKGVRNGGTMTNVFIPYPLSEGQAKYLEAIENCRPYPFKVERGADCAPEGTVTVAVGDPGVVSWANHGLAANQPVVFAVGSGGAIPAGLTAGVTYYVVAAGLTANTFSVSATEGGAGIETTSTGTAPIIATASPIGMTDLFYGLATDGARSGGGKSDLYTRTWPIAVDGRVLTV